MLSVIWEVTARFLAGGITVTAISAGKQAARVPVTHGKSLLWRISSRLRDVSVASFV